ncbi:MAG: hypothetical protein ACYC6Y_11225, partial [Thermoguttaceae bacterium]
FRWRPDRWAERRGHGRHGHDRGRRLRRCTIGRGGCLVASALSAMPEWTLFDPLPVLDFAAKESWRKTHDEDEEAEQKEGRDEGWEQVLG